MRIFRLIFAVFVLAFLLSSEAASQRTQSPVDPRSSSPDYRFGGDTSSPGGWDSLLQRNLPEDTGTVELGTPPWESTVQDDVPPWETVIPGDDALDPLAREPDVDPLGRETGTLYQDPGFPDFTPPAFPTRDDMVPVPETTREQVPGVTN